MTANATLLDSTLRAIAYQPQGDRAGNLSTGRGVLDGRPVRVALVENRFASGAIGRAEAERLLALFKVVALERSALVLYLDSAGAKISEGLAALGAFRALYRAGLEAVLRGAPVAAILGTHCYGGSSMLAHLASRRLFGPGTRLAMSGPAILAAASGLSALDEAFRAMAESALSPAARIAANAANSLWIPGTDPAPWLREALAPRTGAIASLHARHAGLAARLGDGARAEWQPVRRRDLEKIYAAGYSVRESQGLLEGRGTRDEGEEQVLGIVGKQPLGAVRAWQFADLAWRMLSTPPARLEVYLDCAAHAARLDDERMVLTEYIVDMGFALACLAAAGTRVGLTIAGQAGGGVYVALAAPAHRVASVYGASEIQVLPGAAVAAILGEIAEGAATFEAYRASGVVDEELKLGIVPATNP
jgi:hypothetical protein